VNSSFQHYGEGRAPISVSLEDFLIQGDYPKLLYKYRDCSDIGKRWIESREVFMANPQSFPDLKDCRNFVRFDKLSQLELEVCATHLVRERCLNNGIIDPNEQAKELDLALRRKGLTSEQFCNQLVVEAFRGFCLRIGVCCLAMSQGNAYLWNKYSAQDSGFCIGYWSDVLFYSVQGGGLVQYSKTLPQAKPYPLHNSGEKTEILIYHKRKFYTDEDEYRTIIFDENGLSQLQRSPKLPSAAYHSITFGKACGSNQIEEIRHSIATHIAPIEREEIDANGRLQLFINSRV
jgi:hypothetical protein